MFTPSKIDEDEMIRYASFSEVLCSWLLSRKASSADKKKAETPGTQVRCDQFPKRHEPPVIDEGSMKV